MRIPVSRALRRMADHAQMAKTQEEVDSYKHQAQEVHHKINFLENCRPDIVGTIDRLKRRRAELAKEMEQITKEIAAEEKKLQELPTMISELKQKRQHLAREAIRLRRRVSEVSGSAESDQRIVESADQIRRRAIVAIDTFLGL
ncbi:uncharacterized protein C2845_PM16G02760 [Panicum miliaceum]|uniref:Aminotransferase-like protein n=1 Tax=Panicum miliaceum TaxID=4540 RepID=A0A3L6PW85_PANMI|nr:uncharacterized protein C2845_PM16G02760 [Panicum miliaceum]